MNWDAIMMAAIATIPPTLVALASWRAAKRGEEKTDSVHQIVNSQRTEMTNKISALESEVRAFKAYVKGDSNVEPSLGPSPTPKPSA
jgi:hypothetical protein